MNNADFSAADALALGDPFVLGPVRLTDRMLARALGASLDQRLAAGCLPESTRLLAARARDIVALPRRAALAEQLGPPAAGRPPGPDAPHPGGAAARDRDPRRRARDP